LESIEKQKEKTSQSWRPQTRLTNILKYFLQSVHLYCFSLITELIKCINLYLVFYLIISNIIFILWSLFIFFIEYAGIIFHNQGNNSLTNFLFEKFSRIFFQLFFLWCCGFNSGPTPWTTPSVLFCDGCFEIGSMNYFPGLASNCNLYLLSSEDYRHEPLPAGNFFFHFFPN
jgi:hypothetical protein